MRHRRLIWLARAMVLSFPFLFSPAADAAEVGRITGRVLDRSGQPVADAAVRLAGTPRRTVAATDGSFALEDVVAGAYLISADSPRLGTAVVPVEVGAGEVAEVVIEIDPLVHRDSIVVTASPEARSLGDVAQPVSVVSDEELLAILQPTLGETLSGQPGVHSTFYGQGASRPIIRGLGGDRVRVLVSGIGTGDVSTTSPDHAVAVETMGVERIEIVRGPATLLYGSSAIGGVVNVIDPSIPDVLPGRAIAGNLELRGGSGADERSGALELTGELGRLAWHVDYARRDAEDYGVPALPEEEAHLEDGHEEEAFDGTLPNSAVESESGTFGLSWVGKDGFLGLSVTSFETLFGVPGHEHGHADGHGGEEPEAEEEEAAAIRSDLAQRRVDLRGEWRRPLGLFRGAKLRVGVADYEHLELEGDEVGTRFTNDSWEARLELPHRDLGPFRGAIGMQGSSRDFTARGEESFTPPSLTRSWGLFLFEEFGIGALRWQLGARWERQETSVDEVDVPDRSLAGLSGSLGVVWSPTADYALAVSVARSAKLPNAEELYSNGPHAATRAYEIGDPTLDVETSLGLDLGLRKTRGRLTGSLNLFANRFSGYIYERVTDEVIDGLQVYRYDQADAEFRGCELEAHLELLHREPHHLELEVMADYVRAEFADSGDPLPRIPPLRAGIGLRYRGERLSARVEGRRVFEQDRIAELESETAGYTLFNASVSYRFFLGGTVHDLVLSGANLTDEFAQVHTSFLKDVAPLPGRDLRLTWKVGF